jgi:hypothetical protein
VSSYFFSIRWPDHEDSDQVGTSLPDDTAALNHAIRIVRDLRQGGEHDDPGLMMIVRNETLKTVLSLPFREARANAAEYRRMADGAKNALERRMWCDMSESWLGMIGHAEREDFPPKNVSTALTSRSQS